MLQQIISSFAAGTAMLVRLEEDTRTFHSLGSAFLCDASGYFLTSAHLIKLDMKLGIIPQDLTNDFVPTTRPEATVIRVSVAGYDTINDVALLKVEEKIGAAVPAGMFGSDKDVELGETCGYIGFPFADRNLHVRHVASAILSAKVISASGTKQYQLDSMVGEGCSGGPLISSKTAKIIGVIVGRFSPTGVGGGIFVGNRQMGTESSISYATCIEYGIDLMKEAGLNV